MDRNNNIQEINLDNIKNHIEDIIYNYCIDNDIDIKNISPTIWKDILYTINITIFRNSTILKSSNNIHYYDIDKLLYIYEIFKSISNKYIQEISQKNFIDMIDINKQTLYNISEKASITNIDFIKMLNDDNEESLQNLLKDKAINPMKILPILNHKHNWNDGNQKAQTVNVNLIARENIQELPVNDTPILLP